MVRHDIRLSYANKITERVKLCQNWADKKNLRHSLIY